MCSHAHIYIERLRLANLPTSTIYRLFYWAQKINEFIINFTFFSIALYDNKLIFARYILLLFLPRMTSRLFYKRINIEDKIN